MKMNIYSYNESLKRYANMFPFLIYLHNKEYTRINLPFSTR